eukprot:TRINITY_DN6712_c0_g1_i3.p1 TRINITY_DN6712_c0_g1~~TRINITY_DN6712_c0_g1_i3.p1  ORF type:complete len:1039 (+),score=215.80 TRINITY_DN6712_c0_g1_i3:398-3118(+)
MKYVQVNIQDLHLKIETLGRNTFHSDWRPCLIVDVTNISLKTTNKEWKPVPLNDAIYVDTEKKLEYLYKQASIGSITMSLQMTPSENPTYILKKLPCSVRFYTEFNTTTQIWVASSLKVLFSEINFVWDQHQWQRIADLVLSLQSCLIRSVPKRVDDVAQIDLSTNKVSYGVEIAQWVVELLKGKQGSEDGWTFFGFGLDLSVSPERKTMYMVKDLGCRDADKPAECWESISNIAVTSVSFRERNPDPMKEPLYTRLVSQLIEGQTERKLADISITRRSKIADTVPEDVKLQIPVLEVNGALIGLQLVFDKQTWKDFYTFVIEGPLETEASAKGALLKGKIKEKREQKDVEDSLSSFYHTNMSFNLKAEGTAVIIPNNPTAEDNFVKNHATHFKARSLAVTNHPDWPFPPFLSDALQALPGHHEELTPQEGTIHKFEGSLEGFACEVHHHPTGGEKARPEDVIIQPANVRIFGRYFPPDKGGNSKTHKLEATLHASALKAKITKSNLQYCRALEKEHREWGIKVDKEEKERRKINKMQLAAASGVEELKSTDITQESKVNVDAATAAVSKGVKYSLDNLQVTGFGRLENVEILFPAPSALGYLTALGKQEEEEKEEGEEQFARFALNTLELVGDNSISTQSAVGRLKSIDIEGIDHPQSPASFALNTVADPTRSPYAVELTYLRELAPKEGDKQKMTVTGDVTGLRVSSVAKPPSAIKGIASGVNVNSIISFLYNKFNATSDKRSAVADKVKQGASLARHVTEDVLDTELDNLALKWDVKLGECEVKYLQKYKDGSIVPVGSVKLSSDSKEDLSAALKEVETQLISTKMKLAEMQAANLDSHSTVAKLKAEIQSLSKAVADAKFQVAELSEKNDLLKTEVKKAKQQGSQNTPAAASNTSSRVRGFL